MSKNWSTGQLRCNTNGRQLKDERRTDRLGKARKRVRVSKR